MQKIQTFFKKPIDSIRKVCYNEYNKSIQTQTQKQQTKEVFIMKNNYEQTMEIKENNAFNYIEFTDENGTVWNCAETNDVDLTSDKGIEEIVAVFMAGEFDTTNECWVEL